MATAMELSWKVSLVLSLLLGALWEASGVSVPMSPLLPPLCSSKAHGTKINSALLSIHNDNDVHRAREVLLYTQSQECYKCDMIPLVIVNDSCTVRLDSRWPTRVQIRVYDDGVILNESWSCSEARLTKLYQEGGNYSIFIQSDGSKSDVRITCILALTNDPADPDIPIYVALGLCFFLIIFSNVCLVVYKRGYIHRFICFWSTESMMSDLGPTNNINHIDDGTTSDQVQPTKERLVSLDTFRGIAIIIMIFVNYGGGKYWFFHHSKWNGLTVADLVFPWFIFIMGTAMVYSIRSQLLKNVSKWKIFLSILRRSLTLFFLGLIINSSGKHDGVDLSTFRIPGVLQRFAGTYFITATIYLFLCLQHIPNHYGQLSAVQDITNSALEWVAQLALVAIHLAITFAVSIPGCPSGYLGPGGLERGGKYFNCTGGVAGYIDRMFFGEAHIYGHPTSTEIYQQSLPYDPEGLLGTLNSCFMCFLGLQAGKIIVLHSSWIGRCKRFFLWSVALTCLGTLLCKASMNEGWIPINKNLWSLSFVLIMAGTSFFLLMVCYLLIDVYKLWSGAPFFYGGMNAIALYVGHEFFSNRFPVDFAVEETHACQLALNLWGTAFWVMVAAYLHRKEIFISV